MQLIKISAIRNAPSGRDEAPYDGKPVLMFGEGEGWSLNKWVWDRPDLQVHDPAAWVGRFYSVADGFPFRELPFTHYVALPEEPLAITPDEQQVENRTIECAVALRQVANVMCPSEDDHVRSDEVASAMQWGEALRAYIWGDTDTYPEFPGDS